MNGNLSGQESQKSKKVKNTLFQQETSTQSSKEKATQKGESR